MKVCEFSMPNNLRALFFCGALVMVFRCFHFVFLGKRVFVSRHSKKRYIFAKGVIF